MNYKKVILCLIVLSTLCGIVSACDLPYTDYGNGILYFHKASGYAPQFGCNYLEAGASMSQYLTDHPEKHIVSIAPDAYLGYGNTGGFYVIVENKSAGKMNCIPWAGQGYSSNMYNYTCTAE